MIEHPYLIALALIKQDGKRALPLGGKSLRQTLSPNCSPELEGAALIQQLLLRVFQKSEDAPVTRAFENNSLLLIQVPMNSIQGDIPRLKAEWIITGDSKKLLSELQKICEGVWNVVFTKNEGIIFSNLV